LTEEDQFKTWLQGSPADAMRIVQSGLEKEDLLAA
jgi:hypothetical protein